MSVETQQLSPVTQQVLEVLREGGEAWETVSGVQARITITQKSKGVPARQTVQLALERLEKLGLVERQTMSAGMRERHYWRACSS